jgi:hypothetical protein
VLAGALDLDAGQEEVAAADHSSEDAQGGSEPG